MFRRPASEEDVPPDPAAMLRLARVSSVDLAAATCKVVLGDPDSDDGEVESPAIPWCTTRSGATRVWNPPSEGEQVLLFCPEGELGGAMVLGALHCDDSPPAGSSTRALIDFADGAVFAYDPDAQHADIVLPAGATLTLTADGGIAITGPVSIEGPVQIDGDVQVTGTLTATEDVVGGGKSLKNHVHTGVQAGGGLSGAPQ